MSGRKILCLFDVDGTLSKSRKVIEPKMYEFLTEIVKSKCTLGIVGGSDFQKISEQMNGDDVIKNFDFVFPENGLVQYQYGKLTGKINIQNHLSEEKIQKVINFCLGYLSKLILPVKRGTFIEFRTGLINVCPVGRSCTQQERDEFEQFDIKNNIRKDLVAALIKEFGNEELTFAIGGQISIDVFPKRWDKTFCLNHIKDVGFDEIHFFGDKTDPGGNDHEIFVDPRVIGHKVTGPDDTRRQLEKLFNL